MRTVLITGGSRGIGLEFAKQYLKKNYQVFAASRHPARSAELQQLKTEYEDLLAIYPLDVSEEESRQQLYQKIAGQTGQLDILINNAGIASGNEKRRYQFGEFSQDDLCRSLLINAVAPLMIAEKFFPLLKNGTKPIIGNISSNSGSIAKKQGNGSTGYGYSSSKAALNMITKMLSIELRDSGVIVVSLHPGWVRTTMLYCENAPLEPFESISGMIGVIDSLEMNSSGSFLDWKGNELPW